jgi:hypothetical protein
VTVAELQRLLADVPDPAPPEPTGLGEALADTERYLGSDAALESLAADTYWPKWHSPWWHMLLLFELGEAQRIPPRVLRAMVDGLNALPLHIFPIKPDDAPAGYDPRRDISCHCALGSIAQVLATCGVDVDRELPWVKPWFVRYQMADGGLNCDEAAYLVTNECPSSMVGTVAPFEAMLQLGTSTPEQAVFVERAATFLVERRLARGSQTVHNAEERGREPSWRELTFPRFYFYDVLRGASAVVRWAAASPDRRLALLAIAEPIEHLVRTTEGGIVRVQRRAYAGVGTLEQANGNWQRVPDASTFPLLEVTSRVGDPSPAATRQWQTTRAQLRDLIARGQLV